MQVFISHVEKDKELASDLRDRLVQSGFAVWNPYDQVLPGDNWDKATGPALEESEIMIVLLTHASRKSDALRRQVQFALTSGNYRGRVVPVSVDMPTYTAGKEISWVLLRMEPEHVDSGKKGRWSKVIKRVQALSEKSYHAAD